MIEKYYNQLQTFFQNDSSNEFCCKEKADEDMTVVHVRGFVTEMPRAGRQARFVELNPFVPDFETVPTIIRPGANRSYYVHITVLLKEENTSCEYA